MFEKYYTKEQLETLKQRYEQLGEAHVHANGATGNSTHKK